MAEILTLIVLKAITSVVENLPVQITYSVRMTFEIIEENQNIVIAVKKKEKGLEETKKMILVGK